MHYIYLQWQNRYNYLGIIMRKILIFSCDRLLVFFTIYYNTIVLHNIETSLLNFSTIGWESGEPGWSSQLSACFDHRS